MTNKLDEDIKHLEEYKEYNERLLSYLKELRMYRIREIMNVKSELNSVQAQMQLSKSELEVCNRLQTIRQLQDQSLIIRQGDK